MSQSELREARNRLRGLPITPDKSLEAGQLDMTQDAQLPKSLATTLSQVADATKMVDRKTKEAAYMASLGHLAGDTGRLQALNQWTRYGWGYEKPPAINPRLAAKINVANIPGMNIGYAVRDESEVDSFGGFEDGGRRGYGGDRGSREMDLEGTEAQGKTDLEVDQAAMEGTVAQGKVDLEVDQAAMEGTVAQGEVDLEVDRAAMEVVGEAGADTVGIDVEVDKEVDAEAVPDSAKRRAFNGLIFAIFVH